MTNTARTPSPRPGAPRPARSGRSTTPADAVKVDPAARAIVRRWRALLRAAAGPDKQTTLIACSGGADSTALLLALRGATDRLAVGHVVHILRTREEELADRDAVRDLAARLGVPFLEAEIDPPPGENMEAAARRLRYAALARMARSCGAAAVVSAHHADDQLETMLLALSRGAGPAGLGGVAPMRRLSHDVTLLRPMLERSRADAQRICRLAGVEWREDRTNADARRTRTKVRASIAPAFAALRPGAPLRAARAAELLRDAAALVRDRAEVVFGDGGSWGRDALRAERVIVVGEGLRAAAEREGAGGDRLPSRIIDSIVRAIRDHRTHPRSFPLGSRGDGLRVEVLAREVRIRRVEREV